MKSVKLFFLMLVFGLSQNSGAQLWSGILAPSRAADWSNAGIAGGIPNRTTQCGSRIAAYNGAGTTISNAISSCAASGGGVVQLGAGTFNLTSGITFLGKSNVTLRGAGADQTFLVFTGKDSCNGLTAAICMEGNSSLYGGGSGLNPDNTANWTAGYAKGTTQVTLSSVANLAVGKALVLDQCNDGETGTNCTGTPVDTGNVYICSDSGGTTANKCNDDSGGTGGASGAQRANRDQIQIVTVKAINGNVVTISPGLYMPNWRSGQSPGAYWSSAPSKANGVEDLSVDFTSPLPQSAITIWNCIGCWVKGIRSIYTLHNSTSCSQQRDHIWIVLSPHTVVRDSYLFGSGSLHSCGYGVEVFGTSDALIENNIFQNMPSPQMLNGPCSGCVVGYNYSINDANDASFLFNSYTLHSVTDNTLAEGNVGNSFRGDLFHGTHHFATAFRNYWNGWETGITSGLLPAYLDPFSRYFNLVGNVFGRTGTQTAYQCVPGSCPGSFQIYTLGTGTQSVATAGDALTVNSVMRWGNYDTVNAAVRFVNAEVPSAFSDTTGNPSVYANPVPANQALPASFYLSSKPVWFASAKPFPPIGPDVTGGNLTGVGGHANSIPAQDCFTNVMGGPADGSGSALTFNADNCYSPAGGGGPPPPSGLSAVAK